MVEKTTNSLIKMADALDGLTAEVTDLTKAHKALSDIRSNIVFISDALARLDMKEPYALEIVRAVKEDLKAVIDG